ncbi:MAG: hypothetical protein EOP04_04180 [Proteobacteria bacterium]|nr:MAG: hypothetical protein EOP04_04180 [Pseudomonadota bacterium]
MLYYVSIPLFEVENFPVESAMPKVAAEKVVMWHDIKTSVCDFEDGVEVYVRTRGELQYRFRVVSARIYKAFRCVENEV